MLASPSPTLPMRPLLLLAFLVPVAAAQPSPGNWFPRSDGAADLSPEAAAQAAREWEVVRVEVEAHADAGCESVPAVAMESACYGIIAERAEREVAGLLDTLYAGAVPAASAGREDLTREAVVAAQAAWLSYVNVACDPDVAGAGTSFGGRLMRCIARETRQRLVTLRDQVGGGGYELSSVRPGRWFPRRINTDVPEEPAAEPPSASMRTLVDAGCPIEAPADMTTRADHEPWEVQAGEVLHPQVWTACNELRADEAQDAISALMDRLHASYQREEEGDNRPDDRADGLADELVAAHDHWLSSRDVGCGISGWLYFGGTGGWPTAMHCIAEETVARLNWLRWLDEQGLYLSAE